jgi:hypothetical protein
MHVLYIVRIADMLINNENANLEGRINDCDKQISSPRDLTNETEDEPEANFICDKPLHFGSPLQQSLVYSYEVAKEQHYCFPCDTPGDYHFSVTSPQLVEANLMFHELGKNFFLSSIIGKQHHLFCKFVDTIYKLENKGARFTVNVKKGRPSTYILNIYTKVATTIEVSLLCPKGEQRIYKFDYYWEVTNFTKEYIQKQVEILKKIEKDQLIEEVQTLEDEKGQLIEEVQTLEDEKGQLQEKIKTLEDEKGQLQEEKVQLRDRVQSSENSRDEYRNKLIEKMTQLENVEKALFPK